MILKKAKIVKACSFGKQQGAAAKTEKRIPEDSLFGSTTIAIQEHISFIKQTD